MRVSEVFTMGSSDDRHNHHGESYGYRHYYYDYYDEGYSNDNYSGFARGPTRPSLLGIIG